MFPASNASLGGGPAPAGEPEAGCERGASDKMMATEARRSAAVAEGWYRLFSHFRFTTMPLKHHSATFDNLVHCLEFGIDPFLCRHSANSVSHGLSNHPAQSFATSPPVLSILLKPMATTLQTGISCWSAPRPRGLISEG